MQKEKEECLSFNESAIGTNEQSQEFVSDILKGRDTIVMDRQVENEDRLTNKIRTSMLHFCK